MELSQSKVTFTVVEYWKLVKLPGKHDRGTGGDTEATAASTGVRQKHSLLLSRTFLRLADGLGEGHVDLRLRVGVPEGVEVLGVPTVLAVHPCQNASIIYRILYRMPRSFLQRCILEPSHQHLRSLQSQVPMYRVSVV